MPPETRKLLFDIQHAALGIQMFLATRTFEDYERDLMLRSAVERQFEIIGEAMTRLRKSDENTFVRITEATRIVGFRNVLIHGYDVVTHATTWEIIQNKLPVLLKDVESLMQPAD